jgi:isoaspartyl peptidase/L-asparaginase-like protein (Ntn-hydrolase superfamily)
MDEKGNAGSVCFVEDYMHPISIARKVMEETPHVMLAGEGAEKFAASQGFNKVNLLTKKAEDAWIKWSKKKNYHTAINRENHDTISSLAIDKNGNLSGACTTSGLGYKIHGRVGDSPIIGAGLYVDNEVGACAATGLGELVMKTLGSFLVVELMRQGKTAQAACEEAILRIVEKNRNAIRRVQVCYIAISKNGEVGSYGIHGGFDYALSTASKTELIESDYHIKF